jgi:hypothetical protein
VAVDVWLIVSGMRFSGQEILVSDVSSLYDPRVLVVNGGLEECKLLELELHLKVAG